MIVTVCSPWKYSRQVLKHYKAYDAWSVKLKRFVKVDIAKMSKYLY